MTQFTKYLKLYDYNIQSVIIEGGARTLSSFINENLWDEARVFIGNSYLINGIKSPDFLFQSKTESLIEKDQLKIYRNI